MTVRERHTVTLPHWQPAYQNAAACTSCCDGIELVPLFFPFFFSLSLFPLSLLGDPGVVVRNTCCSVRGC